MTADSGMNRAFTARPRLCERGSIRATLLASTLVWACASSYALGLGRPVTASSLGQSLNVLVPLQLDSGEVFLPECVSAEVQAGEARLPKAAVRVGLEAAPDGTLRALRVLTQAVIEEPIVVLNLSVGCPARLSRQFTLFMDPPLRGSAAVTTLPSLSTDSLDASSPSYASPRSLALLAQREVADASAAADKASRTKTAAKSEGAGKAVKVRPVKAAASAVDTLGDQGNASPSTSAKGPRKPAPAAPGTAKLHLDVAEFLQTRSRLDAPSAAAILASPGVGAAWPPDWAASAAADAAKLKELEAKVEQMHAQTRATQEAVGQLRSQLAGLKAARTPDILTWGLGALALAFGGGLIYLWRMREDESRRREDAWWTSSEAQGSSAAQPPEVHMPPSMAPMPPTGSPLAAALAVAPADSGRVATEVDTMPQSIVEALMASREPSPALHEQTLAFARVSPNSDLAPLGQGSGSPSTGLDSLNLSLPPGTEPGFSAAHRGMDVSVEELIDLQQQTEFFEVLGQDEAAIELLLSHINTTGRSALPYLKLLEIHKRLGDAKAHAQVRERFALQFGVQAPSWDADEANAAGLEGHAEILAEVQRLWADIGACMAYLQQLLVSRRDLAVSESASPTVLVDLACNLDMLLLYSVARDLSEHEVRGDGVDVFLPLDFPDGSPLSTSMMATLPVEVNGAKSRFGELDLDITVGESEQGKR